MSVPKRVHDRVVAGIRRYQQIFAAAKRRDVSESDTAVIIADFLADVLGYEKYVEITTEFAIRGTYCDLAIKLGGTLCCLIEVKAIGVELKDQHVKQAVDYAANQGSEWIALTNGAVWRIYRVEFSQPIGFTLVAEMELLNTPSRDAALIECFESLSREGFAKDRLTEFFEQRQATSRYALAATLLSEPMLKLLRRELRRVFPGVKVTEDFLEKQLKTEVLKRELVEGDHAAVAASMLRKLARRMERQRERARTDEAAGTGGDASAGSQIEQQTGTH
ncbi:restriction endonuclease subunit R [Vineibacter terrae]|uniref:Restriction endonuclease subunit R n=1 Tax=Vineibacter terrae TaxID=2586908 RepID=A0A5C8PVP3_9HYPH|nr:type I restriction enzyme HsdR N-terminal domain-containing protein [Vineibacter terrae]TXL81929.1 restriction endonuclease subunit R [Vineibacter terrae]